MCSAHAEQPHSGPCVELEHVCSSWEVKKWVAVASSLHIASLEVFHYIEVWVSQLACLRWEESSSWCVSYCRKIWTTQYVLAYLLALRPGGLWKHCSTWRALNVFVAIWGQTQRQDSYYPSPKIKHKIVEAELNTYLERCEIYAIFCLVICRATAVFFFFFPIRHFWLRLVYSSNSIQKEQGKLFRKKCRASKSPCA